MRADGLSALCFIFLATCVLILVESNTDTELEFLSEPSSRLVKPSDGRATFRCNVSPPSAEVRWLWRGQPVVQNRWIKVSRHKLTVHLGKMDKKSRLPHNLEKGFFQCEARIKGKVLVSAPAKLIIAILEPFLPQSDIQIGVTRGNTAVIPCNPPRSVPAVVTEFQLNGTVIDRSSNNLQLMPSGNLQVLEAKSSDSGEYVCTALNPYLSEKVIAKHKVILTVKDSSEPVPPTFIVYPPPKTFAVLGSNVSLECAVNGFPVPSVTWRRHHDQLPKRRFKQTGGNLYLFDVRRDDEGVYYCEAQNSVGEQVSKSTEIYVQETPHITKAPRNTIVEAGQNLTLHCSARGHPKPGITWIHNGKTLILESGKESHLVLLNVKHRHSGIYQCFANNELGTAYATCLVTVTSGNKSTDADFEGDYEDYDSDTGPNSQVFHHKKDVNLEPKGDPHASDHESDKINKSELDGDPASKKHKKKKSKGVKLVPPSRPEISRLSDTSVMVRWYVPRNDGLTILFFKVQYREVKKHNAHWMTIDEDIDPHIHSYAVTDLKTGAKYRFRIAAVYSNDDNKLGPNSAKFILYKDPPMKMPAVAPQIIHAEAASPSAITLEWEYEELDTVPIEGFFIYYRATHSAGDYLKITVLGSNTHSHIISHLLPDTSYDAKMQSFNIAGTSEFSNIYTCKTRPSEVLGPHNRSTKPQHSEEVFGMSATKPVSSKNSDGNMVLYIVLGVICTVMLIASSVFVALCIRQRQTRHPDADTHIIRETPQKSTNGHLSSNGYVAVRDKVNINVNPLSHLDSDDSDKADQFDDVLSNNNEIMRMQTFSENVEQQEPLLVQETTAGAATSKDDRDQETEATNVPNDCDTSVEVPRSI